MQTLQRMGKCDIMEKRGEENDGCGIFGYPRKLSRLLRKCAFLNEMINEKTSGLGPSLSIQTEKPRLRISGFWTFGPSCFIGSE